VAEDADILLDFLEQRLSAYCELTTFIQNMTDGDAAMLWNNYELAKFSGAVQRKISPVYGEDAPNPLTFRHRYQCRIG
jgi:hypothetical protein